MAATAFTRAESRFLQRDAVFLRRMPFRTFLSRTDTVSLNVASSVVLSQEIRVVLSSRNAERIRDLLARLVAVLVSVCRARFSAEM